VADTDWLAQRFEAHRAHLRAVAYRMLGSVAEVDDVVQDAWFRLARSDTSAVDNLGGWLTTVVARLCLDALRTRKARKEEPTGLRLPEPVVGSFDGAGGPDPEQEALLADSVGLAMMVVLDALAPAERLAFVLHDVFAMPFDEIAPIDPKYPSCHRQRAAGRHVGVRRDAGPAPRRRDQRLSIQRRGRDHRTPCSRDRPRDWSGAGRQDAIARSKNAAGCSRSPGGADHFLAPDARPAKTSCLARVVVAVKE
jgi:RNA polymerase sigma factor (sigma-70 family)